jgi:hypothetical protein
MVTDGGAITAPNIDKSRYNFMYCHKKNGTLTDLVRNLNGQRWERNIAEAEDVHGREAKAYKIKMEFDESNEGNTNSIALEE